MKEIKAGDTLRIGKQDYLVLSVKTPGDHREKYPLMARTMREKRLRYDLYLKKPKGRCLFTACMDERGRFGPVVKVR